MTTIVVALASPLVMRAWNEPDSVELRVYAAELRMLDAAARAANVAFHVVEWRDTARLRALAAAGTVKLAPLAVWDYVDHFAEIFQTVFDEPLLGPLCRNVASVLRFNGHKRYLLQLADHGIPIVTSKIVTSADAAEIFRAGFSAFADAERLVFKPTVGAGAHRQVSLTRTQWQTPGHVEQLVAKDQAPFGDVIVQPFLDTVSTRGEVSLLFFGHVFSHAVHKLPAKGDYRVQHAFAGTCALHSPTAAELALAQRVIDVVRQLTGAPLHYARVDFMFASDGAPLLGEIELFEPYLYLSEGTADAEGAGSAATRLINALKSDDL